MTTYEHSPVSILNFDIELACLKLLGTVPDKRAETLDLLIDRAELSSETDESDPQNSKFLSTMLGVRASGDITSAISRLYAEVNTRPNTVGKKYHDHQHAHACSDDQS